ncbi:dihydrofolate reductase [bacterium]|nr:dihydrofolate reductase [bacterium]
MDSKSGIGLNNKLPWYFKEELTYFREITSDSEEGKQNAIVMGRKTWDSLPFKPLKNRKNVVLSFQDKLDLPENVLHLSSIDELLNANKYANFYENLDNIFIIGGASIYEQAISNLTIDKAYITKVAGDFSCDTVFSGLPDSFQLISKKDVSLIDKDTNMESNVSFCVYQNTH